MVIGVAAHPQGIFVFILPGIGGNVLAGIVIAVVQLLVVAGMLNVDQTAGVAVAVHLVFLVVSLRMVIFRPVPGRINLPCIRTDFAAVFHHRRIDRPERGIRIIVIG